MVQTQNTFVLTTHEFSFKKWKITNNYHILTHYKNIEPTLICIEWVDHRIEFIDFVFR